MASAANLRHAATVVVVRDAPAGLQLLLLQRAEKGDHNSGAWVFPGGLVDAADRECHASCVGLDDAQASARLRLPEGGLDAYVAAIRECFEEAGLLFAVDAHGQPIAPQAELAARLAACRDASQPGGPGLAELCRANSLWLAVGQLHYIGHWVTPLGRAKRFDTRFFVAVLPPGQDSAHDAVETTDHVWLRPAVALSGANTRRLMTPTRAMIEQIAAFEDCAALLRWAALPRDVPCVLPRLGVGSGGLRPVLPDDPAWAEIGRLDPQGRGDVWCELRPGVPVRLSARVLRLTAADHAGNSYLVSAAAGEGCAVIDPATADEAHLDALLAAAPGPIRSIFLCATGGARAAAAARLRERTGARVHGPAGGSADTVLAGGQTSAPGAALYSVDAGASLQYLLVEENTLFVGDAGCRPLPAALAVDWLAPGHGFLARANPWAAQTP